MAAVATSCCTSTLRYMPAVGVSSRARSTFNSRSSSVLVLRKRSTWRCMSKAEEEQKELEPLIPPPADCCNQKEIEEVMKAAPETVKEEAKSAKVNFQQIGPTKQINRVIALGSVLVAVGLFASGRLDGSARPGLGQLTALAVPYEEALANGRPTVVEFYADWCEVCREMAKDVYKVEEEYRDRINFVMLNVDNPKWEPELDEFGVEGIPHFAFLDRKGNEEGNIVGRLPPNILRENVMAMSKVSSVCGLREITARAISTALAPKNLFMVCEEVLQQSISTTNNSVLRQAQHWPRCTERLFPFSLLFVWDQRMKFATTTLVLDYVPAPFKNIISDFVRTGEAILNTCFLNAVSFIGSTYVRKGFTLLIDTEVCIHDKPPGADTTGERDLSYPRKNHVTQSFGDTTGRFTGL